MQPCTYDKHLNEACSSEAAACSMRVRGMPIDILTRSDNTGKDTDKDEIGTREAVRRVTESNVIVTVEKCL